MARAATSSISVGPDSFTFTEWLRGQIGRNDPVGDLANDAAHYADRGTDAPPEGVSDMRSEHARWLGYLSRMDACSDAQRAFLDAWREYRAYRR